MTKVEELKRQLAIAEVEEKDRERREEIEKAKLHVYPDNFPWRHEEYYEGCVLGSFYVGPCDDDGEDIWSDLEEARRRWEAYPKLVKWIKVLHNGGVQPECGEEAAGKVLKELGELE